MQLPASWAAEFVAATRGSGNCPLNTVSGTVKAAATSSGVGQGTRSGGMIASTGVTLRWCLDSTGGNRVSTWMREGSRPSCGEIQATHTH